MATYLTELHDQGQARPFGAGGPGGRPRYLPTGRGTESGGGRPRARPPRLGDRGAFLYGRDAPERGERAALGRCRRRRRGKTNQEGETKDVRFVKGGVARAIRTLRAAANPATEDRVVPLSPKIVGLRFKAAVRAGRAGFVPAFELGEAADL